MTHLLTIGATAVALGVLESGVRWNTGDTALMAPIIAAAVIVSLLWYRTGSTRAERDETSSWQAGAEAHDLPEQARRDPRVRALRAVGWTALVAVVVVGPTLMGTNGQLKAGVVAAFALVGVSVVVLTGWAGQISLGQMAFVGAGAAVAAWGITEHGWDPFVALLVGGLTGAATAVLVGLPALRVRGLYLAVVTLAIGIAASEWVFSNRAAEWIPETSFDRPPLLGRVDLDSPLRLYWFALGVLALGLVALVGVRRSRTGRVLVAMRDNEPGVTAFGVRPTWVKLSAFATSGFLAACAGVVIVVQQGAFRPVTYAPEESVSVLVATVVGGIGSLAGGVAGAVVQRGSQWLLPAPWSLLATGAGALLVLLVAPGGLAGVMLRARDRLARRVAGAPAGTAAPQEPTSPEPAGPGPAAPTTAASQPAGEGSAGPGAGATLLQVRGLWAGYGDLAVVRELDLDVRPGEVLAVLGGNGAGKTTLLRTITGVLEPLGGEVRLDGADLTGAAPERIAAAGITAVPGGEGTFPGLTVRENLQVGAWLLRRDHGEVADREAAALAAFPSLAGRLEEPAANLSGGQQQMLALAMAMMSRPRLLVIDELSLGLAPLVVGELAAMVRSVASQGTAVLLVEQSLNVALTMADRALFLEHGESRFSGPAAELAGRDDLLREVFLAGGRSAGGGAAAGPAGGNGADPGAGALTGPPVLSVTDLVRRFGGIEAVSHVGFEVHAGGIVGLIGQNGAGKTTVVDLVCGFQRPDGGRVELGGRDVTDWPAARRFSSGLGRTFQGGRLFPDLTVAEAIAVGLEGTLASRGVVEAALRLPAWADTEAAVRHRVAELAEVFGLGGRTDTFVAQLSTGTRRVVELAAAVAHQPSLLLLDEPAAGLAQPEVEAMAGLLRRIRDELGCAILLIEHDMPLVAEVSDRLVALESGSVIAEGDAAAVLTDPLVVASYLGNDDAAVARSGRPAPAGEAT